MSSSGVSSAGMPVRQPLLTSYDAKALSMMIDAADTALECQYRLEKLGLTLLDEIGHDPDSVEEWRHYPEEDVYDRKSGSQFYYHRHRDEEHGHFHLFHRPDKDNRPGRVKMPSHLMAISMDQRGVPIRLFTTNRWVTGERWRNAGKILELARHFQVEHAEPALMLNRWVTAMVSCCRPQLQALLLHRDQTIGKLRGWRWRCDVVLENRELEVIGELALDLPAWREQLKSTLREKEPS